MTRNNRRKRGGKAGAYETAGGPGGTAQQVLGPVDGNLTQPSPATPRKSPLSLLGSGVRTPPRTPNASRFLTRNTSEPGVRPTPSTPSARGAGPDTRPCADSGEGRASDGAPFIITPKMQQKRGAAGSGRGLRPSGGRSRSHRERRKERTAEMERLPGISGRLENEEYREQQRVAREEKVARRAQEIADDQTKKDEASRRPRPGRRSSTGAGASPSSSALFVDPRRRQSAPAALGGNQPRSRMIKCGRVSCGWAPSASDIKCGGCRGEVVHSTTDALCAACHRYLPGGKATHLRRERQQRARVFVQSVQAGGDGMPAVVVRNFEPSGDCLCLRSDFFHAFLKRSGDGQPQGPRRCSTCKECKKGCQWHNVGLEDSDGRTVEHTGEAWSGAAHVPPVDCHACYLGKVRRRNREAAANATSHADVLKPERLTPMEFKGEGWCVDPKRKGAKDEPLTADNLVIELSEHSYIGTDRKTRLLTGGCDPEKAAKDNHRCKRCSCKGKKCSLLCACNGRCYMDAAPAAPVSTDDDSEGGDAERHGGNSVGMKDADGDIIMCASGGEAESDGVALIDISGEDDPGVNGWLSSDSDSCDMSDNGWEGFLDSVFPGEGEYGEDLMEEVDM